jgi:hypothetical protein
VPLRASNQAFPEGGTLARFSTAPSLSSRKDTTPEPQLRFHDTCPYGELIPHTFEAGFSTMAAMMPSASTSSGNPYDDDAVERDLIDPDDGA